MAVGAALLLVACRTPASELEASVLPPPFTLPAPLVLATRNVAVGDVTTADVFAPEGAEGLPVVVMFHGTEGRRDRMEPLAVEVAQAGAVVVVPSWPVISERPPFDTTEDLFRDQTVAAVCSVRFARSAASEFGGDATEITVLGHSGGAALGARVSLIDVPPWPGIDCFAGVSAHVDRFVGTGGDYHNAYQFGVWVPEVYRPYDLFALDVTNRDLGVYMVHGAVDLNVNLSVSSEFKQHLERSGIAAHLLYVDAGHSELIDPSRPGGRFVADQLHSLLDGRMGMFGEVGAGGGLTFDDTTCSYRGPASVSVDRPVRILLINDSPVVVWFAMAGVAIGVTDDEMRTYLVERRRIDDALSDLRVTAFLRTEPYALGGFDWLFLQDAHRWVTYCMPANDAPHDAAGLMLPAGEVVLVP